MKLRRITPAMALLVVAGMGLAACDNNTGPKQTFGTLGGAALGGLAGSQIGGGKGQLAATAAGVLIGAFLGNEVGSSLDKADRAYMQNTTVRTLETAPAGETVPWHNPDSGNQGTVTVQKTYERAPGQYCREFRQTVEIDGKTELLDGTACRQSDGTWRMVDG